MTIELGAMALRYVTVGGRELLRELSTIDGQAKAVSQSATRAGVVAGEAMTSLAPKAQRAAAVLGAVSTAAAGVIPEMEGVAAASALAETSLAGALSTVPVSAWVAGIGLAIGAMAALVGWMRNASDVPPPGDAWKKHIDSLKVLDSAQKEYNARRAEEISLDKQVKALAVAIDTPTATDLAAKQGTAFDQTAKARHDALDKELTDAREKTLEAGKQLEKVKSEQINATRELIITGETSNAEAALTIQKAAISQQEAVATASYQRGTTSLQQYYATRRSLVQQGADAEIAALKAKDRALATARPTDNPDDVIKRDLERGRIRAEITARVFQSETELTNLRREEAQATIAAIATEVSWLTELAKVHRVTNAEKLRALALDGELKDVLRAANTPLAERLAIMQKIAALQQAGLGLGLGPSLTGIKNTSSIDVGKVHVPASVQDQLNSLTPPLVLPIEVAFKQHQLDRLLEGTESKFNNLGLSLGEMFANGFASAIATSLVPGSGHTFIENFGNTMLQGLGEILVQMGTQLMVTGAALLGLLPFLSNPFTSGAAMLGAGVLITAAGAALGAIATNNGRPKTGGGGGGGGFGASSSAPAIQVPLGPRATPIGSQGYAITSPTMNAGGANLGSTPRPVVVNATFLGRASDEQARWVKRAFEQATDRGD